MITQQDFSHTQIPHYPSDMPPTDLMNTAGNTAEDWLYYTMAESWKGIFTKSSGKDMPDKSISDSNTRDRFTSYNGMVPHITTTSMPIRSFPEQSNYIYHYGIPNDGTEFIDSVMASSDRPYGPSDHRTSLALQTKITDTKTSQAAVLRNKQKHRRLSVSTTSQSSSRIYKQKMLQKCGRDTRPIIIRRRGGSKLRQVEPYEHKGSDTINPTTSS
ncbi:hypothetical protein F5B20DRAFT_71961 [Whalleya microplaca]|nr:hypothetical protein F5B20DRAFT_71961 [Whalleya microplaca]